MYIESNSNNQTQPQFSKQIYFNVFTGSTIDGNMCLTYYGLSISNMHCHLQIIHMQMSDAMFNIDRKLTNSNGNIKKAFALTAYLIVIVKYVSIIVTFGKQLDSQIIYNKKATL